MATFSLRRPGFQAVICLTGLRATLVAALLAAASCAGCAASTSSSKSPKQRLAVPAFFGVNADWGRIEAAKSKVLIVVPDASFKTLTGTGLTNAQTQFAQCRKNHQHVFGYVDTGNGTRAMSAITADINKWFSSYSFPNQLDGIFFDNGPELDKGKDSDFQKFYKNLAATFRRNHPKAHIFLNASLFPNEWVMKAADYAILFEGSESDYLTNYKAIGTGGSVVSPPSWWKKSTYNNSGRIVHVIYACPAADMHSVVQKSRTRKVKTIYVIDQPTANYPKLPPYWDQELVEASS